MLTKHCHNFLFQDFEEELQKIEHSDGDNMIQGQSLLQALAVCKHSLSYSLVKLQ